MPDLESPPLEQSSSRQRHPSFHRTENIRRFLDDQSLAERVRSVINFMQSLDINLPIFLWAISWNIPELVSDPIVASERTSLMLSDELPGILAHWCRPPRKHNSGVRTKAAYDTINKFALESVKELVENEMDDLDDIFSSPQSELSEESLLSINWNDLMANVRCKSPTTWSLIRHAAYSQKQESRNTTKDPDTVSHSTSTRFAYFPDRNTLVCPHDDRDGSIFAFTSSLQDTEAHDNILQELWAGSKGLRHT